jgi:hypothetical protein
MVDWKSLAKEKRDSINALIPKSWLLPAPLPSAAEQRDVTGKYIQQFLSPREIEITETDAVGIVKNTTSGTWKAREVAEAFCHRASLAHQMVHNPLNQLNLGRACADSWVGQLSSRNFLRRSDCRCPKARRLLCRTQETHRTPPRSPSQSKRSISCQRCRNYNGIRWLDWHVRRKEGNRQRESV